MDNARHHNLCVSEIVTYPPASPTPPTPTPTSTTMTYRKAKMQDFLTSFAAETKVQLLMKIRQHMTPIVYRSDMLAQQHGHVVLRTSVRHCELHPIELIWANCKDIASHSAFFQISDFKIVSIHLLPE